MDVAPKPPRRRVPIPLALLPREERLTALRLLSEPVRGGQRGSGPIYDPEFHPADLIDYFERALEALPHCERRDLRNGDVRFVLPPHLVASISGWCASVRISRTTLHRWKDQHPDFAEAYELASTISEHLTSALSQAGSINPKIAELILKSLHDYSERIEARIEARAGFVFRPVWSPREEREVIDVGGGNN